MNQSLTAAIIFVLVYAVILGGKNSPRKLGRPAVGLIVAVLMVLTEVLSRHEAIQAIDFSTIALLPGIMFVAYYVYAPDLLDTLLLKQSFE